MSFPLRFEFQMSRRPAKCCVVGCDRSEAELGGATRRLQVLRAELSASEDEQASHF